MASSSSLESGGNVFVSVSECVRDIYIERERERECVCVCGKAKGKRLCVCEREKGGK